MPHLTTNEMLQVQLRVRSLIRRRVVTPEQAEDMEQDLLVALLLAEERWDAARASRSTYLARCLDHAVGMFLRRRRRYVRRMPQALDTELHAPADPRSARAQAEHALAQDVSGVLEQCSPWLRQVAFLAAEHSVLAMSRQLGCSRRQVENALKELRAAFTAAGYGPDGQ